MGRWGVRSATGSPRLLRCAFRRRIKFATGRTSALLLPAPCSLLPAPSLIIGDFS
ncbi:MAG: hypothetical protein F6K50_43020 [Moorea sp. SIO3I7]|nr:hypothetical protein [Moorena sp. SIO3I7]NEO66589.1 hypothetical protein [Moorena sp. SIO4G2]